MEQETRIERRRKSEMFWKLIWPMIIVIIFGSVVLFANGCGGGGSSDNSDSTPQNQASDNPPSADSNQNPPVDNNQNPPADQSNNPPVDIQTAGLIQLPKTGQIVSRLKGDDGDLQAGVPWPNPRFIDNGDSTVTDNLTGLMWTKDADLAKQSISGSSSNNYIYQARHGGYSDWRLPSIYELESLIDVSQALPALPVDNPFLNVKPSYYWSSTDAKVTESESYAAVIDFSNGAMYMLGKNSQYGYIWGVRSSGKSGIVQISQTRSGTCYDYSHASYGCSSGVGVPQPNPRLIDNNDGTVSDKLTGLMWTKNMNIIGSGKSWDLTLEYVAAINRGEAPNFGYTDWRIPNRKELLYMLDWTNNPSTNFVGDRVISSEVGTIWSSTTVANDNSSAWYYFILGHSIRAGTKSGSPGLWPVRTISVK